MPGWVKSPGSHPLVAAFPVPEVDVVESSFHVQTVTTVTTDHVIGSGTEKTYSTAKTKGTSTSVANTKTWNSWQEVSESLQQRLPASATSISFNMLKPEMILGRDWWKVAAGTVKIAGGGIGILAACGGGGIAAALSAGTLTVAATPLCLGAIGAGSATIADGFLNIKDSYTPDQAQRAAPPNKYPDVKVQLEGQMRVDNQVDVVLNQSFDTDNIVRALESNRFTYNQSGQLVSQRLYDIARILSAPVQTTTQTQGKSWGGSQTTTTEQYEEHTITNSESFSNSESWGNATAVDSAHAADLWFTYNVRNTGTEYAREIADLTFNIYIGDDSNPAYTYHVANDLGGDGKFHNFMPGEEHTYTSVRIPHSGSDESH